MGDFGSWVKKILDQPPARIAGALAGFVCGLLFILIGFWNTVLILFLTLAGLLAGMLVENGGSIGAVIDHFRGHGDGDDR